MKIWSRIGAEQGGQQSPMMHSPAATKARRLRPLTLLALTREGSICEGGRFSRVRSLHPGRLSGALPSLEPPVTLLTALLTRKSLKI